MAGTKVNSVAVEGSVNDPSADQDRSNPSCHGLFSGRMTTETRLEGEDLRKIDPQFQVERFRHYLTGGRMG